ncbi:hypothetical protein ACJMK2_026720 [Sinanodonta woodiana]|uniref:Mab-21-like nucleotidyltransferase domain-containing protein n=1 Tax=Sinanodonta woodiana TaxID=1069815 RepID=A0ABD3XMS6_SINWO
MQPSWDILAPLAAGFIILAIAVVSLWRKLFSQNIGINMNEWQCPVKEFASADRDLERRLKRLKWEGDLDTFERVWNETTSVVDAILKTVFQIMRAEAREYEGLVLDGYRKYGSAREGLLVRAPDTFDVLLEYRIDGLRIQPKPLVKVGVSHPGLGKLKILNAVNEIENKFKTWLRKRIIVIHNNTYFLDSHILHVSIFKSIADRLRGNITNIKKQSVPFQLRVKTNASHINIQIQNQMKNSGQWRRFVNWIHRKANIPTDIDINIVPAMKIKTEKAKGPRRLMKCPRYAIVKPMNKSPPSSFPANDPAILWRFCVSGYETHYLDMARNDKGKRYIMTACRIFKTFIHKEQEKVRSGYQPLPISTFFSSYYLKNIAFYCMQFTESVKSVREALGYFLIFLKICLEEENLPQFFRGNKTLMLDFPSCAKGCQVNLFRDVPPGALGKARTSFNTMLLQLPGMYDITTFESATSTEFRKFVSPMRI